MSERLLACLADDLLTQAVVVATVAEARGATPRKAGSRMLVGASHTAFSVGGGLAEARVIAAARTLLQAQESTQNIAIDLGGGEGAAGVCGGRMEIALHRWSGERDARLARELCQRLADGERVQLPADKSPPLQRELLPSARLLIVGAGHCGLALYEAARRLDFDIWVFDTRADVFSTSDFAQATVRSGDYAQLAESLDTAREVVAVLLNRDFSADVATLVQLCRRPPAFLGMMGSSRRIRHVVDALPQHAELLARLHAPIGIDIGAQTPEEIAISILAQIISWRQRRSLP